MSKTHFQKLRNKDYLGSWDLLDDNGKVINKEVTIKKVDKREVHDGRGGSADLPIIHFNECKPMVGNAAINLNTIASICGSEFIEDWIGNKITLTVKKVKAFGAMHDAIRVVEHVKKPEMKNSAMDDAIKHVKNKTVTIEQIQQKYSLTTLQLKKLEDAKN